MILLDTHVVLWWTADPTQLSRDATTASADAKQIAIAAISFWEISMLVRKRKIVLGCSVAQLANQVLAIPRIRSVALTPTIAIAADQLDMHADLADRFIVASAAETQSALVTKDALIRSLPFVRSIW
jgi:PIN domain nuclease of toxin-antitoxin system